MPDTRFITEFDQYLFGQGTHYDLYNKLGAHPMTVDGEEGVYFAVWAPNAAAVSIVGDFNEWDENATPMERLEPLGIYQIFLTGIKVGDIYKNTPMLRIYSKDRWIQFFIWDNSNERSFPAYNYCEIVNDKYEVEQMIADFINNPEKLIHILQNGFNALNKEIKESNEKVIQYKPKRLNNKKS